MPLTGPRRVLLLPVAALGVAAGMAGPSPAARVSSFPVTVRVTGKGRVTSSPRGLSCPNTCSHRYPGGTRVQLKANPARGWRFVRWSGGCEKTVGPNCTLSAVRPVVVLAFFARRAGASPPPSAGSGKAEVWTGSLTMKTSRSYMHNGSVVNYCTTNWAGQISFRIATTGAITGIGHARLTAPRSCTASGPFVPQVEKTTFSIGGSKGPKLLALLFGARQVKNEPKGTAEFGGLTLLYANPSCPFSPRSVKLPLVSAQSARLDTTLTAQLAGCGGSENDVMKMALHAFAYRFNCTKPPPHADPDLAKLCS